MRIIAAPGLEISGGAPRDVGYLGIRGLPSVNF